MKVRVGGGLNYAVGPQGAGKTLYGVRHIVHTLIKRQYVLTNVQLLDGWEYRIARHYASTATPSKRRRFAEQLRSYYIYEAELSEVMRYRLPGKGEARGLFLWDETHNDIGNRSWKSEGREEIIEWGTQLRKLGFVGFLLSQHADNTDVALRRVCGNIVRLQNQREQTRVLGMRVTPWPLFLACWYPTNVPLNQGRIVTPFKVERYFLGWHRHLYDTHDLYHGLATPEDENTAVILLPEGGMKKSVPVTPAEAGKGTLPDEQEDKAA